MSDIKAAAADGEKYELINSYGQEGLDLVKDIMVEYWQRNERLLSPAEACDIAEKYYEDEVLERLSKTKKIQARLGTSKPVAPAPKPTAPKEQKAPSSLSNKLSSSSASNVDLDKMSREDALEHLAKRLKFNQ